MAAAERAGDIANSNNKRPLSRAIGVARHLADIRIAAPGADVRFHCDCALTVEGLEKSFQGLHGLTVRLRYFDVFDRAVEGINAHTLRAGSGRIEKLDTAIFEFDFIDSGIVSAPLRDRLCSVWVP